MTNPYFQIPDIFKVKSVLCVQPHPDDMDLSIGGTVKKLTEAGVEVQYLTVTDDSAGFLNAAPGLRERADIRKDEQRVAGAILGVSDYHWLDFPDAGDWSSFDARNRIIDVIRRVKPEVILTVDPNLAYEGHGDHLKAGRAATEAAMFYNFPHIGPALPEGWEPYELQAVGYVWSNKPNSYIDTTVYNDVKFEAVSKHESQFPTSEALEQFQAYLTYRASVDAADYDYDLAETLKVLPPMMLHCFPEAADF